MERAINWTKWKSGMNSELFKFPSRDDNISIIHPGDVAQNQCESLPKWGIVLWLRKRICNTGLIRVKRAHVWILSSSTWIQCNHTEFYLCPYDGHIHFKDAVLKLAGRERTIKIQQHNFNSLTTQWTKSTYWKCWSCGVVQLRSQSEKPRFFYDVISWEVSRKSHGKMSQHLTSIV